MSDIIVVEDLKKTYRDGTEAVKGVNFSVREGEFFGFLGPNGAGKSTTIKILTTLLSRTSGTVTIDGLDVKKEAAAVRRTIGYSAQETGLDDELTGSENIQLLGRLYHMPWPEIKSRSAELLDMLDLTADANRPAGNYSGGMRKRLDVGCALMHRPKVLILDEPTTGLDPQTRASLWDYLSRINSEEGITILLTTHYMDEADRLCRRLAVIDHGEIIAQGSPAELRTALGGAVIQVSLLPVEEEALERLSASLGELSIVKEMKMHNQSLNIYAQAGEQALTALLKAITEITALENVSFSGPTLDDVFIKLTGRKIRDEEAKPKDFFAKQRQASGRRR